MQMFASMIEINDLSEPLSRNPDRFAQPLGAAPDPLGAVTDQGQMLGQVRPAQPKVSDHEGEHVVGVPHRPIEDDAGTVVSHASIIEHVDGHHLRLSPRRLVASVPRLGVATTGLGVLSYPYATAVDAHDNAASDQLSFFRRLSTGRSKHLGTPHFQSPARELVRQAQSCLVLDVQTALPEARARHFHRVRFGHLSGHLRHQGRARQARYSQLGQHRIEATAGLSTSPDTPLAAWPRRCSWPHPKGLQGNEHASKQLDTCPPTPVRHELSSLRPGRFVRPDAGRLDMLRRRTAVLENHRHQSVRALPHDSGDLSLSVVERFSVVSGEHLMSEPLHGLIPATDLLGQALPEFLADLVAARMHADGRSKLIQSGKRKRPRDLFMRVSAFHPVRILNLSRIAPDLDTLATYRRKLAGVGQIDHDRSSVLIVVGRDDTGDLEAQIRGSRFAWDMRLISVESLLTLMDLKEDLDDPATLDRVHQILVPREFTRLDAMPFT